MGVNAEVGDILLRSVHVEAPGLPRYLPGQNARVWLTLLNSGRWPDALAEVSSPVARDVAIRWDRTCDGRFETVSSLPLAPQEPVPPEVAGGVPPADAYHLVMVDLTVAVVSGSNVPLTLRFRDAGEVTIEPFVQPYNEPRAEPSSRCNR